MVSDNHINFTIATSLRLLYIFDYHAPVDGDPLVRYMNLLHGGRASMHVEEIHPIHYAYEGVGD